MRVPFRYCHLRLIRFSATVLLVPAVFCQPIPPDDPDGRGQERERAAESRPGQPASAATPRPTNKRILWIIPNYRTYPSLKEYKPIPTKQKFSIAVNDSFDRGTVVLAAAFAGEGQISHATPEFGQGVAGYAQYFSTSYADLVIGNFMTEAIYPTILHQDPRFFRRGTGSGWSRVGYAVAQVFWTHRDRGGSQFNFSEIGGNASAVALSTVFYPGNHEPTVALSKFGMQVGVDLLGNLLKEFWPDLDRKFARKHDEPTP